MEGREPIAIIGMSCRYPKANNAEELWQLLIEGGEGLGPIPQDRLDKGILSAEYKYKRAHYLTTRIDEFDAKFFEVSSQTAKFMDPQLRLLLELTWEALEDSCVNPQNIRGSRTGIFVGSWLKDYEKIGLASPEKDFFLVYMGQSMAARIAYFLRTVGPAMDTESACSSSMVAVHLACQALRDKSINLAVVGGVNLLMEPPQGMDLDLGFVTSLDGRCKSFDVDADGYGRAEGCGVLVLKRLSDAVSDNDRILAMIKGTAVAQEGLSRSMGTPTVHSEKLAMLLALENAGVEPSEISYLEAHGTGTQVGDRIEAETISKVYSSKARTRPLIIGSVKANLGHSEACSGVTSIIKTVLCIQHGMIPRQINFKRINPNINFEKIPAILPLKNTAWLEVNSKPRMAGVSSFGISGTDCHVILQEYLNHEKDSKKLETDRPLHIMTISTKSGEALKLLIERYCKYLKETESKFEDIAFTTNTGRASFDHKIAVVASDKEEAYRKLVSGNYFERKAMRDDEKAKICMLFPGIGSQYHGMTKNLYEASSIFKFYFDECCKILLEENSGIDLKLILWGNENSGLLTKSINGQVAIFCVNYCLFQLWTSWGVKPDYVLGHSLGESVAVVAIGARDLRSGIKAVLLKCQLVDSVGTGKMIAVRMGQSEAEGLIGEFLKCKENECFWLDVAAINSPEQTVLAGESNCIDAFHEFCKEKGVKSIIIASSHAFHSRKLEPILEEIRKGISEISKNAEISKENSNVKYISSSEARIMTSEELLNANYWVDNTRNTVKFMNACQLAVEEGCRMFVEIGAQPILSTFVKANFTPTNSSVTCLPSLKKGGKEWDTLLNSLAQFSLTSRGKEINWSVYDKPYNREKVSLPHYPFVKKSYLIGKSKINLATKHTSSFDNVIHPLLGHKINLAGGDLHIFQNEINLSSEKVEFLKDHLIGETIVFPGAAFLEICLTAAALAYTEGRLEITLENFKISSPLRLTSDGVCKLQTVAKQGNDGQLQIEVFHNEYEDSGWLIHSSTFCNYFLNKIYPDRRFDQNQSIEKFKSNEERSKTNDVQAITFYKHLSQTGLNFGNYFQTFQNSWSDPQDKNTVTSKIKIGYELLAQNEFKVHPVVADAMIQSTFLILPKGMLHVPVAIKRVTLLGSCNPDQDLYVWCKQTEDESKIFNVKLIAEDGREIMLMEELQMHATNVANIEKRLEIAGLKKRMFYKEEWIASKLEFNYEPSEGRNNLWLLIGNDPSVLDIANECLGNYGKEVAFISTSPNQDLLKNTILSALNNHILKTEGVIYMNGLCDKSHSQQHICQPLLYLCQWLQENYHLQQVQKLKLAVITHGVNFVVESDIIFNPSPATLGGMIKVLKNECPKLDVKWIDVSHETFYKEQMRSIVKELMEDGYADGWKYDQIALRNEGRYVAKLIALDISGKDNHDGIPLFRYRCSSYMITGGMHGLGFQMASWIMENGGKNLILVGRSKPSPEVDVFIKEQNLKGRKVHIFNADVGDFSECSALFSLMQDKELPPLRGIFHCAGVLEDASISNQTWRNFEAVFRPKVDGTWNLHLMSLYYKLDYFVTFSSFSALFGIPGQINYAAGNCYQDALIRYRHSLGLAGTSINWGNWEGIGMAKNVDFPGVKPISIEQGFEALEIILRREMSQVCVANFYSFSEFAGLCPRVNNYVDEELLERNHLSSRSLQLQTNSTDIKESFISTFKQIEEDSLKIELIQKHIEIVIKDMLNMEANEEVDPNAEFHTLGIDSLMIADLQSKLQEEFGEMFVITMADLRDFPSLVSLSRALYNQLFK